MVRKVIVATSSVFSLILLVLANLIPYKRTWGGEEIYVSSDALLVVFFLLFASSLLSVVGLCLAKNRVKMIFLLVLIVNIFFIFQGYTDDIKYIGI